MIYRVIFFKNLLNSNGQQFRCLQQSIVIPRAESVEQGVEEAKRRFERLCHVVDWRLYADGFELEMDQRDPSAKNDNHNERRDAAGAAAGRPKARAGKLRPEVGERTLGSVISMIMSEDANRSMSVHAKRSRAV